LFPLYLTPFESYMLWDDRADLPMTFVVRMDFSGDLDRVSIEKALPLALQRHPLLQAVVRPAKGKRDCWVAAPNPTVMICWNAADEPLQLPQGERIDLRSHVGLRIWIQTTPGRTIITTQFHHACCDGIGAYQFLGDWLWLYARETGAPIDSPLPAVDFAQLRRRTKASYDIENYRNENNQIHFDYREAGRFALRNTTPLAAVRGKVTRDTTEDRFPALCEAEFDKATYKRLRHVGEARGQSTNELLVQQLFVTMKGWNESQGDHRDGQFCVMMPMDLREIDNRMNTALNLVTYALIRRHGNACDDEEKLADSLRQEMLELKHTRHRTAFMNIIAYFDRYPFWLKRLVAGRKRLATAILSNTGDPTKRFSVSFPSEGGLLKAGNLVLQDIVGVPPMRRGTHLTLSIFTYRRVLKICLRCDPNRFTRAQSQAFLDRYVASINALLTPAIA